jgi:hypothetical protein
MPHRFTLGMNGNGLLKSPMASFRSWFDTLVASGAAEGG